MFCNTTLKWNDYIFEFFIVLFLFKYRCEKITRDKTYFWSLCYLILYSYYFYKFYVFLSLSLNFIGELVLGENVNIHFPHAGLQIHELFWKLKIRTPGRRDRALLPISV